MSILMRVLCFVVSCVVQRAGRGGISEPFHQIRRAFPCRRPVRLHQPRPDGEDGIIARAVHCDREPRRRRRTERHRLGGELKSRWLHHRNRAIEQSRDDGEPARKHAVPAAQGPRTHHSNRFGAGNHRGQRECTGEDAGGIHRACQSAARQAGLRFDRYRRNAAYGHGAARADCRNPACARALQWCGACRERPAGRPCPDNVCGRAGAARQH